MPDTSWAGAEAYILLAGFQSEHRDAGGQDGAQERTSAKKSAAQASTPLLLKLLLFLLDFGQGHNPVNGPLGIVVLVSQLMGGEFRAGLDEGLSEGLGVVALQRHVLADHPIHSR